MQHHKLVLDLTEFAISQMCLDPAASHGKQFSSPAFLDAQTQAKLFAMLAARARTMALRVELPQSARLRITLSVAVLPEKAFPGTLESHVAAPDQDVWNPAVLVPRTTMGLTLP
jgi:hypothetical protein